MESTFDLLSGFASDFEAGTACDVGANIGNHSRYFAEKFKRVIAFEPNQMIFEILRFNTKSLPNVTISEYALGNFSGEAQISGDKSNIGGFSIVPDRNLTIGELGQYLRNELVIQVRTLDSMIEEIENLQLVKIDVEGFEQQVLEGAKLSLVKFKPVIAFEQWPSNFVDGKSEVVDTLRKMGYVFYWHAHYSTSTNKLIYSGLKWIQSLIGFKMTVVINSNNVPENHYSMLIAVHESKTSKMRFC